MLFGGGTGVVGGGAWGQAGPFWFPPVSPGLGGVGWGVMGGGGPRALLVSARFARAWGVGGLWPVGE